MKKLIIVGAGGFGREVLTYCWDMQNKKREWEIKGFIDDNTKALDGYNYDVKIIGTIKDYSPEPDDIFAMAIGLPIADKLSVGEMLVNKGASFISVIHPTAQVNWKARVGNGCVIAPLAGLSCDVSLADFVVINSYASMGHDTVIGKGSTIGPYASVAGKVRIGQGVSIGIHAVVLPGVEVGDYAVIGAGSVVFKKVKPHTTVMGVPAKKIL